MDVINLAYQTADSLSPLRTALLVIDVQYDFVAPDGVMGQSGCDLTSVEPALKQIDTAIATARAAGVPVIFARVITRPETDSQALVNFMERRGYGADAAALCRADSPGSAYFHVKPQVDDVQIEKRLYSSFSQTPLAEILRTRGIDTLILVGFSTNCCVETTARDGFHHDFNIFVVEDACGDYSQAAHDASLAAMGEQCALIIETETLVHSWAARSID